MQEAIYLPSPLHLDPVGFRGVLHVHLHLYPPRYVILAQYLIFGVF